WPSVTSPTASRRWARPARACSAACRRRCARTRSAAHPTSRPCAGASSSPRAATSRPSSPTCSPVPEVLRIIARLNVGGPARHVLRLDAPLRRRGWRTVLATGCPGPGEGDLLDDARALRALRHLVRELRPDVVHAHTAKAGLLGRLAAGALSPAPARVHTFHGHVLAGYFGAGRSALWRA